jgi:hypothetical protein
VETKRLRIATEKQVIESGRLLGEAKTQNETALDQQKVNADLLKESQRQTEISIQPMFAMYFDPFGPTGNAALYLENVGNGPAFNIAIQRCDWVMSMATHLKPTLETNVLKTGVKLRVALDYMKRDERLDGHIWFETDLLNAMAANSIQHFRLIVQCADVSLTPYTHFFDFVASEDNKKISVSFVLVRNSRHGASL